ncbi:hypothetical protein V8C35DRAFT_18898 [Trichoderma chlorosporum]
MRYLRTVVFAAAALFGNSLTRPLLTAAARRSTLWLHRQPNSNPLAPSHRLRGCNPGPGPRIPGPACSGRFGRVSFAQLLYECVCELKQQAHV